MIYIGIGSNLSSEAYGPPLAICRMAVARLVEYGNIAACSPWYESAPVPVSDQPWFVNGVIRYQTDLEPAALLDRLHVVEESFGRVRRLRNEARVLDLDLLAYANVVIQAADGCAIHRDAGEPAQSRQTTPGKITPGPMVPHPRMHERAFVLLPLRDIAPDWIHPVTGDSIARLIAALPVDQDIRRVPSDD